jgi:hypothetical protein
MDIVQGQIGTVGQYEVDIAGGKLVLKAGVAASPVGASLEASVDLVVVKDAIKAKIPGQIDDVILDTLFAALASA